MKHINAMIISSLHYLTMALFLVMLSVVFLQVILRYFVGTSLSGSEEASRFMLFFVVMLGASICTYENSHLRIEYFYDKFNAYIKRLALLITSACILFTAFIFIYYGWDLATRSMNQTTPSLRIPRGWIFMAFPVTGVLILFFQVQHLVKPKDEGDV